MNLSERRVKRRLLKDWRGLFKKFKIQNHKFQILNFFYVKGAMPEADPSFG